MQKGLFLVCFFLLFGGSVFCCLCFCRVFCKKAQKGYFPAILEVFCQFCSHQRPVLKCFFSSYFVFFVFVFLFKNPFLYFLFVHQPLFNKRLFVGFLLFFFCLSFPFLSVACLFDTNFPNISFWNPICFRFCLFLFSSVVVVVVVVVVVSAFLFFCCCVGFVFGVFVLFCFVLWFCFCSSFLFCFQSLKKGCFPAILVFFWAMLVKRVVWFLCFMFLFLFVFLLVLFLAV